MGKVYSLFGLDGNAYSIMRYVAGAMSLEKYSIEDIKAYREKAMSKDYDNLLQVSLDMIDEINQKLNQK